MPVLHPQREADRKTTVRLIYIMFWMLIFEGAIRKWVAPQYSSYLYFMRDPVCLLTYFYALRGGLLSPLHPLLAVGLGISVIALVMSVVNLVSGNSQYTLILATYGFRNYFFYLPLAFVIARTFRYENIRRMAVFTMLAICIAAPIAVLQFKSSPSSVLNTGTSADPDLQFKNLVSSGEHVRPAGTFTSVMGMIQLSVSTLAFLVWTWTTGKRPRPIAFWFACVGLLALATAVAVSGSRTIFVYSCLVIATSVAIAPFLSGTVNKIRVVVLPLLAIVVFAALFPIVFPDAFQAFTARWSSAAAAESNLQFGWFGRALYGLHDFVRVLDQVPINGYGIGIAGNGAATTGVTFNGSTVLRLAEEDWSRNVVELGPALALVFIMYRVSFGVWLGMRAVRAAIAAADPLPVLLFAFCGVPLVYGQITAHGLVNGFGWLYVGMCMAVSHGTATMSWQGKKAAGDDAGRLQSVASFPNLLR